ncbi:MAG: metallophosphoesterase [Bacteriodetes bacterium]|nr:metallophosphoesterase [Bacteroidota bacterium]
MIDSQVLVVGDVHGCFHTFKKIVIEYWNPEKEILVQVGDLIDRGLYSPECVGLARMLNQRYPNRTFFIKGNHELEASIYYETQANNHWIEQGGAKTLAQYKTRGYSFAEDVVWFNQMPLYYESNYYLISHAGVTDTDEPFDELNSLGVVWNRSELKNIGKVQIIGHTPLPSKPEYRKTENVWNIDTGAYRGNTLTGLRLSEHGDVLETIQLPTDKADIAQTTTQ